MRNICRVVIVLGGIGLMTLAALAPGAEASSPAPDPEGSGVVALSLTGVVDPFMANYAEQGIRNANTAGANAVLLTIDTPGGFDSSMRQILQAIDGSRVAVICYVAPSGARAASCRRGCSHCLGTR